MPEPGQWESAADFAVERDAGLFVHDACVALVHGRSPREALAALAQEAVTGEMPAEAARAWAETQEYPRYGTSLEAGTVGDWTLVVELNGYQASEHAVALSAGTVAAVTHWSGSLIVFTWAVDGQRVRRFDALVGFDHENPWEGKRLAQEKDLPFGLEDPRGACLALMQRLTGVHISARDVADPSGRIALGVHPG